MNIFSALAQSNRRQIIEILASQGQLSSSELADKFIISPPAVSQHLKVLLQANLVNVEKKEQKRLYSINPQKILEIEAWAIKMKSVWNSRFDKLDKILSSEKETG